MFSDGGTNVHDEERSVQPYVMSDELVQIERLLFKISKLSFEFPQISSTVLYEIITVRLDYLKFCARWLLKMLAGAQERRERLWL
jgi:hypothetical protein